MAKSAVYVPPYQGLRVLIDVDNVLAATNRHIQSRCRAILGHEVKFTWYHEDNGRDNETLQLIKAAPGFWRAVPQMESAHSLLTNLRTLGFDIHLVTGIPHTTNEMAYGDKLSWIWSHWLDQFKIHLSDDRSVISADILVDDSSDFVPVWKDKNPNGLVLMPEYDYNSELRAQSHDWLMSYKNSSFDSQWPTILGWLREKLAR